MPDGTAQTGLSESAASGLAYFTFIPAIIFLVVAPYNTNARVKFHCWQSIFLTGVAIVVWVIDIILAIIPFLGWLVMLLLSLGLLALWILCVVKAFNGGRFVIPVIGALAEKQAGS